MSKNIINQISEEMLQIIDKYELSIAEYNIINDNIIDVMENIAIIPSKRRYSRSKRDNGAIPNVGVTVDIDFGQFKGMTLEEALQKINNDEIKIKVGN